MLPVTIYSSSMTAGASTSKRTGEVRLEILDPLWTERSGAVPVAITSPGAPYGAFQPAAHPEHVREPRGPLHLLLVSLLDALVQFLLSCSFYSFPEVSICQFINFLIKAIIMCYFYCHGIQLGYPWGLPYYFLFIF